LGGGAAAKQFGVGVASGCNLMAMTVDQYLRNNPGHIAISCDTRNAFGASFASTFPTLRPCCD
jgi:hypothetical protein